MTRLTAFQNHFINTGVGRVWMRVGGHGAGLPLICVHGLVIPGHYMMPFARLAARRRRVFVPDLPGYGRSGRKRPVPTPRELADSVAAMMDSLGLEQAHLLGNSYGSQILAEFAVRHPARVGKLVFVGPTVNPERRTFAKQCVDLLACAPHERLGLIFRAAGAFLKAGPRIVIQSTREALGHEVEHLLPLVRAPVLVICGEHDAMARPPWRKMVAEMLPDARLMEVPGGGHALNDSHAGELARRVDAFLENSLP